MIREQFVPIQIDSDLCMRCERCLRACKNDAIYFENSLRYIDYSKCKACLVCVQVCPRNAIVITSIMPKQVLTIKVNHDRCTMCGECIKNLDKFCPNNLFYVDKKKVNGIEIDVIKFNFQEVRKCKGCLKCELNCPENAIKPIEYEVR